MSEDWCPKRFEKTAVTDHCLHDTMHDGKPSMVCCWCGDLFHSEHEGEEHGEYAPAPRSEG